MRMNDYQRLAMRTNGTTNPQDCLMNAVLGLNGEAGEIADHVKKAVFHGHTLDHVALAKELGDILWYIAQAATASGFGLDEIAAMNIDKLRKRYPEGFSSEASINRAE